MKELEVIPKLFSILQKFIK